MVSLLALVQVVLRELARTVWKTVSFKTNLTLWCWRVIENFRHLWKRRSDTSEETFHWNRPASFSRETIVGVTDSRRESKKLIRDCACQKGDSYTQIKSIDNVYEFVPLCHYFNWVHKHFPSQCPSLSIPQESPSISITNNTCDILFDLKVCGYLQTANQIVSFVDESNWQSLMCDIFLLSNLSTAQTSNEFWRMVSQRPGYHISK